MLPACRGIVTQWDVYFEQYQSIYTAVPVMTLPGEHVTQHMTCL